MSQGSETLPENLATVVDEQEANGGNQTTGMACLLKVGLFQSRKHLLSSKISLESGEIFALIEEPASTTLIKTLRKNPHPSRHGLQRKFYVLLHLFRWHSSASELQELSESFPEVGEGG